MNSEITTIYIISCPNSYWKMENIDIHLCNPIKNTVSHSSDYKGLSPMYMYANVAKSNLYVSFWQIKIRYIVAFVLYFNMMHSYYMHICYYHIITYLHWFMQYKK